MKIAVGVCKRAERKALAAAASAHGKRLDELSSEELAALIGLMLLKVGLVKKGRVNLDGLLTAQQDERA
jgi:hypothetical protein